MVILFDGELKAEEVRLDLLKRQNEHLVDLDDAAILVMNEKGKIRLHHVTHLTLGGAVSGGFMGALFGVILLNPVFVVMGLTAGAALEAISGSAMHLGIDELFMKELAEHLSPGTSALGVPVRETLTEVLEEPKEFNGTVFRTSLSKEDEAKLLSAFDASKADPNPRFEIERPRSALRAKDMRMRFDVALNRPDKMRPSLRHRLLSHVWGGRRALEIQKVIRFCSKKEIDPRRVVISL